MALRPLTLCTWATTKTASFFSLAAFVVVLCCYWLGVEVTSGFDLYSKVSYSRDSHLLIFIPLHPSCTKTEAKNFKRYFQPLMWDAPQLKPLIIRYFQHFTFALVLDRNRTLLKPNTP
ncbi:hypothetical protein [Alkalimarinus alittae]|uniref:Uncharacterized protein n=1 Tax=Alkalimarinus alittae TaxID=2961619 RepID=A0ABY6N4Y6_9ALTE|nr:hypothetical protein [Alkalimarinus alittae]UZE97176.1 hypothetical protein NKI27_05355 [Alkalimarinus alittae]